MKNVQAKPTAEMFVKQVVSPRLLVSGAGRAGANGVYGQLVGTPGEYVKSGGPGIGHYIVLSGGGGMLYDNDTDEALYSSSVLIGLWETALGGETPLPTVAYA
jgi:hypothetical protein